MSGTQVSSFPDQNILYNMATGATGLSLQQQQNQLMQQQQDISGHEIEMGARLAGTLLSAYDTPEARAAAYPTLLAQARAQAPGYFKNAPAAYPGDESTRALSRMGTPSAELFKLQGTAGAVDAYGGSIGIGGRGGGTTTGGGGGTGTATGGSGVAANAGALRDQLVSTLGVSPVDAGAILSNFHAESGLNAGINEIHPVIPGSRGGYGLAQWTGPRRVALENFAQQNKLDVSQPATQLAFMKQELQQPEYASVLKAMQAAQTPEEKAAIFFHGYLSGNAPSLEHNLPGHVARARAYAGLPAATTAATQPQGAPGASTAPGVVTGDAGRPGDVPPPPGGAPGAYGGGGFGAVVGRPAATVGTSPVPAGRPTGPPVVTDQPAGGGVVAGPPGTAVVGQPVPPSPAVAGNVDAINAGIVRAGGQPVTDPNLTPTPARYAGTAPAPSAEAPPQPGWGTGVGTYGPQNALAPAPVPAAPARPATPAAQQPPAPAPGATTAQPAAQAMPPEIQTDNSYLTAKDKQALAPLFDQARRGLIPLTTLQNEVQQRQTFNVERQKDFLAAQHQAMEDQRQREADARATQSAADTAAKAELERKKAADPIQGTDDKSNADRTLFKLVDKMNAGTATPEERRLYAQAAQYYLKPQMQWISDPNEPTKSIMVPVAGQLPYGFPHPSFQPGQPSTETKPPAPTKTDFKPLPDSERKLLVDTSTRLDQLAEQRSTFKPDFGGFGSAALGEAANLAARNLPASPTAVARADWWQNYQRMKLAVRQGISGQSLTASELAEFDKADINPGMSADRIAANLAHQDRVLRTSHERRVRSLAADRYSPDAIREAGGIDPTTAAEHPAGVSVPTPPASPPPAGFKVIVP